MPRALTPVRRLVRRLVRLLLLLRLLVQMPLPGRMLLNQRHPRGLRLRLLRGLRRGLVGRRRRRLLLRRERKRRREREERQPLQPLQVRLTLWPVPRVLQMPRVRRRTLLLVRQPRRRRHKFGVGFYEIKWSLNLLIVEVDGK